MQKNEFNTFFTIILIKIENLYSPFGIFKETHSQRQQVLFYLFGVCFIRFYLISKALI